jgi:hypothetical protein
MFRKIKINYLGWDFNNIFYYGTRFNSGVPYSFFRIGPIIFKRYL